MKLPTLARSLLAISLALSGHVSAESLQQFDIPSPASRLHPTLLNTQQVNQLAHQAQDPYLGNSRGNITVVEFFDYRCGYCLAMQPRLNHLLQHNPNVKIVVKILAIQGDDAVTAAQAALVANQHGHFLTVNNTLVSNHAAVELHDISQMALSIGMSYQDFNREMSSESIAQQMLATQTLADNLGVSGTPAFYVLKSSSADDAKGVNAYIIHGYVPEDVLQAAVASLSG